MLTAGFSYHLAKGGYAMLRAKIMLTHRHDFKLSNHQIEIATRDCDKILYMHKDAMLAYFAIGALKCGAVYPLSFEKEEWQQKLPQLAPRISHAVTMNQMAQWKGWQPISLTNPAKLSFWRTSPITTMRMRIKNPGGQATITLRGGKDQITASVPESTTSWITFDTSKIDRHTTYDIMTSTNQLGLGGIRLDDDSNLYWPWDQGVALTYHRAIPYQYTSDINWRFDTREIFPIKMKFEVIDDHSVTILANEIS